MNNNIHWRLQICSHKEIFTDRDTAMKYIRREFLPDSMVGEPTLYFYGDSDEPNAILAFGVGDRRIATIDVGAVSDRVDEIETSETENFEKLDNAIATLKDVINAAGLTFDENKIQNQVTYEPDVKDELIGDTTSLGEAIAVISKFAQDSFKSTNLIPVESKSIAVSYTATDKGMELKPSVKFSTYGDADTLDDNNNILGLKPDGIYATVNLEYDPEKCELSFVTSGMKDGKFMDDANRKVIKLGEHTQYTPDNNGYNVNLVVDKDKNTISANVKISEDPNNILSVQDEKLFVDGRAANIKYKSGTVYSGINQLETSFNDFKDEVNSELDTVKKHVSDVEENTTIEGDTTDTMVITATKETNVGYRISGGVRLGSNKTIIHKDGGLEVDIEITCDIVSNKLIVRTGNVTKEVELPGVDFIDNAYYDSVTQELVIEFNNGNTVRIPMSGLITIYTFENNTSSPVVFQVNDKTRSTEKVVTTAFRLASNDNILSINGNGELIAPKSTIDNAVAVETSRAQIAEKLNADAIDTLEDRATAIETNVSLLQAEDRRLNIITSETNSIALTASKADGGTTLKADLKLNTTEDNIIKLDGNGVYSSVALNYNKAENSIALIVNGNEKSKFTLSEHSLVQEGHYDSVTQNIVLTIAKDGGETQQISIPVGDIVNEWTIDNGTDNPITLTKTAGADNVDVLRARLTISTEAHNGILNNNGTLYMSNEASKLTALWGGDEVTVQKAIENLKIENDKVAGLVSDVDTLKSDMAQAKNDITVLQQGNVANLQTKVEQNTRNIAQNTSAINNLTTQVTELGSQVTNLSNQFTELSNQVGGYEDRISKLEGDLTTVNNNINTINQTINQIKEQIGEPEEGKPSVAERLTTIEEIVNNLIDFGAYESNF